MYILKYNQNNRVLRYSKVITFLLIIIIERGGRVVEGARLESVYPDCIGIEGSNPFLSAK